MLVSVPSGLQGAVRRGQGCPRPVRVRAGWLQLPHHRAPAGPSSDPGNTLGKVDFREGKVLPAARVWCEEWPQGQGRTGSRPGAPCGLRGARAGADLHTVAQGGLALTDSRQECFITANLPECSLFSMFSCYTVG